MDIRPIVNLDEEGMINQFSHFTTCAEIPSQLKDKRVCIRADDARMILIENLKLAGANVYIDDSHGKILIQITKFEVNTSNIISVRDMFKAYDL